jgi:hypothetical protein
VLFLGFNVFSLANLGDDIHSLAYGKCVGADEASDGLSHISNLAHFNEDGNVVKQGAVLRVFIPRQDWQALLRLQHVRSRRVVNDNRVSAAAA